MSAVEAACGYRWHGICQETASTAHRCDLPAHDPGTHECKDGATVAGPSGVGGNR